MLAGIACPETGEEGDIRELLDHLPQKNVVLTGVDMGEGQTGVALRWGENCQFYVHRKIGGSCSGTGDLFAACFVGALMRGREAIDAVKIAADFTCKCVENTLKNPVHWYGIQFEPALPELIRLLEAETNG